MSVSSSLPVFWARQDSSSSFATLASVPWLKLHLLFHLNTTLYSLSTELITSQSYTSKSQPVPPPSPSSLLGFLDVIQTRAGLLKSHFANAQKVPISSELLANFYCESYLFLPPRWQPSNVWIHVASANLKVFGLISSHWRKSESAQMNIAFNIKQWWNESVAALRCCTGWHR